MGKKKKKPVLVRSTDNLSRKPMRGRIKEITYGREVKLCMDYNSAGFNCSATAVLNEGDSVVATTKMLKEFVSKHAEKELSGVHALLNQLSGN